MKGLLEPLVVKGMELQNRLVVLPMAMNFTAFINACRREGLRLWRLLGLAALWDNNLLESR